MADTFPVSGNIDPSAFPHLLVDLHRQGATGSLRVNGPVHPKALYFRGGRILFGSSNDPRDQLGAILIESGKITREQLDEVNAKVGPGNPLAKVLAESGFVNQRELGDAARVKVERILSDVLSWESGSFEFEDGVLPKGAVDLKLSTGKLLLAAIQRIEERSFALRHLGGDMTVVLEPAPEEDAALEEVRADVWPLLERLDGERTLQDAVALTRLDEFDAAKTACAMIFLGIARKKQAAATEELDLAQEARSGFDEAPEAGPVVDPLGAEEPAFVVPSEEPAPDFPALDAEPFTAQPIEESASATVAFMPEAEPEFPAPAAMSDPEAPPNLEPTGFAFVESEPLPVVAPVPEEPPVPVPLAPSPEAPAPEPPAPLPPVPTPVEPTVAFHGEAPAAAPVVEPTVALPAAPPAEPPEPPTPPPPAAPSFDMPPARSESDTVPGDRPVYVPPPMPTGEAPPAARFPAEPGAGEPPAARPTKEDLAALDALLNPAASGTSGRKVERPRSEKWEPQFRTGNTSPPRRSAGRTDARSRAPLVGGLVVVAIAAVAGGYYWLSRPSATPAASAPSPPAAAPTPALSAPATVAAAPPQAPAATPATGAAPPPAAGVETPAPTPTPPPAAAPPAPTAAAPAPPGGDPSALLRQGALDQAAAAFAATLASGPRGRYAIQALVACSPETVHKAVQNVPGDDLFILPVNYKGRDCHRICWGVYPDLAAAEAAAGSFPTYFRENRIAPRIQPLVDLLP